MHNGLMDCEDDTHWRKFAFKGQETLVRFQAWLKKKSIK
jgi:hypothetical protein